FASTAVMGAVGIACKAALALGTRTTTVVNRDAFVNLLLSQSQVPPKDRRGILVVANHRSTLDDPFMWGTLPLRILLRPDMMRWTLGAQELCFATPAASTFFTLGQTVPTLRGAGITQPAIDEAINRLDAGQVIHIFPEGHVNQDTTRFRRFKWGLARMLLETQRIPYVVPVFLDGFEKVMPMEPLPSRKNATKFPIPGQDVAVAFGKP
ncbi:acyltransferase-domain-containing protein, partial [Ramicandelaber brevisporus]